MKAYSNQIVSENFEPFPSGLQTTSDEWWFIYNLENKEVVSKPMQCSALAYSPFTIVVADSLEECEQYISTNGLSSPEYLEEN